MLLPAATADKNGVAVFEAWAQYDLTEKWSARMGRQVLILRQSTYYGRSKTGHNKAQSHDALLLSFILKTETGFGRGL
jgi:hypothetical protein